MTDIEFLIFSLEIFSLKIFCLKKKYDIKELQTFRVNVLMTARVSSDFEDFKYKLSCFHNHKLYILYLRYIRMLDKYYQYIKGERVNIKFM